MDEAEDLVQQAFIRLWEKRALIDIQWSLKSYLYKSVHNAALNRIRHEKVKAQYQQLNAVLPGEEATPAADEHPELLERIGTALNALPPQCRQIFELSRFESLKYREIAEQLNLSIKTVETQMGKALRLMRLHLSDYLVLAGMVAYQSGLFQTAFTLVCT